MLRGGKSGLRFLLFLYQGCAVHTIAQELATGEKATPNLAIGVPLVLVGILFMLYGDVGTVKLGSGLAKRGGKTSQQV